jgi:hypothetical protein
MSITLSEQQLQLIRRPIEEKVFLEGPAGAGKTSTAVARLLHMLEDGVPARQILVLTPQRTLATPYYDALRSPNTGPGTQVTIATFGGLAQRLVDLLWPLVAEDTGFARPELPPTFLTLETAQYYMARLVRPLLDEGYFDTITIDRNRLYSQILDNLNKAAVVDFPHTEIGARLKAAWGGEQSQKHVYDQAQECAIRFREHCLNYNLLDFSLQFEILSNYLWELPLARGYLLENYTHIIADNIEEDIPVAHSILLEWLEHCSSALLVYDQDAGYRRFLGADPASAYTLQEACSERVTFTRSFVTSPESETFGRQLSHSLHHLPLAVPGELALPLVYEYRRYFPEMLDWVAQEIDRLVNHEQVPPGEIVVLAPYLTDALRFSLANRLAARGIPSRSHRPSRSLRDEPATQCLLTLAALAHPQWGFCPQRYDVSYALMQAIEDMDLVRAQLMAEIVYRVREGQPTLSSFDQIHSDMQGRLTYVLGERYDDLRVWLEEYTAGPPAELDHFLSRLFGELLSQPGYGFHDDYDAAEVTAKLIESVSKFRWIASAGNLEDTALGKEYVEMVQQGVVAAQYILSWQLQPEDAVLLSPAYTFLMSNRAAAYQFWLDVGGKGWWERLNQPLTQPYVLSRHWPQDQIWSDADERQARQEALHALTLGLIRRCRHKIYLGLSELDEQGNEQKGPLLAAIQRVLRQHMEQEQDGG